jgi:hypothetical protein
VENPYHDSMLQASIQTYMDLQFKSLFGLSLTEYLQLPRFLIRELVDLAKRELDKRKSITDSIKQDLDLDDE